MRVEGLACCIGEQTLRGAIAGWDYFIERGRTGGKKHERTNIHNTSMEEGLCQIRALSEGLQSPSHARDPSLYLHAQMRRGAESAECRRGDEMGERGGEADNVTHKGEYEKRESGANDLSSWKMAPGGTEEDKRLKKTQERGETSSQWNELDAATMN